MSIHLHSDSGLNKIREDMSASSGDFRRTRELIHEAFLVLLRRTQASAPPNETPILALRGGLLGFRAASIVYSCPIGLVAPRRAEEGHTTDYGDVPRSPNYLLVDTIANSGATLIHCLESLIERARPSSVRVTFLFGTREACSRLQEYAPQVEIHAGWNDFVLDSNGRLEGINYDAGDYAMMDPSGKRLSW